MLTVCHVCSSLNYMDQFNFKVMLFHKKTLWLTSEVCSWGQADLPCCCCTDLNWRKWWLESIFISSGSIVANQLHWKCHLWCLLMVECISLFWHLTCPHLSFQNSLLGSVKSHPYWLYPLLSDWARQVHRGHFWVPTAFRLTVATPPVGGSEDLGAYSELHRIHCSHCRWTHR